MWRVLERERERRRDWKFWVTLPVSRELTRGRSFVVGKFESSDNSECIVCLADSFSDKGTESFFFFFFFLKNRMYVFRMEEGQNLHVWHENVRKCNLILLLYDFLQHVPPSRYKQQTAQC